MSCRRRSPWAHDQKGLSLIELMVALSIGLIIVAATFSAYLGASGASKVAEAQGLMNEDAQAALTILAQQLRMAGSNPEQPGRTDPSRHNPVYGAAAYPTGSFATSYFTIRGCDGRFSNALTATRLDDLVCPAGASAMPDAIALSYEADRFNTVPTTTGSLPTDCLGIKLTSIKSTLPTFDSVGTANTEVSYAVADNRFYIDMPSGMKSPSLYCQGNGEGSTPHPLVENVEDLQLSYGTVSASDNAPDATVAGYLSAQQIVTEPTLALLPNDAARWAKVLSVRVCVVVRSAAAVVPDAKSARYFRCDGTLETAPPDLRLRRAYSTTVVLRNRRL